jgi:hypothetical protein
MYLNLELAIFEFSSKEILMIRIQHQIMVDIKLDCKVPLER